MSKYISLILIALALQLKASPSIPKIVEKDFVSGKTFVFNINGVLWVIGLTKTNQDFNHSTNIGNSIFILNLDHSGKIVDKVIVEQINALELVNVIFTLDSNFVILSRKGNGLYCNSESQITKFDKNKNLIWTNVYNIIPNNIFFSPIDEQFILFGSSCLGISGVKKLEDRKLIKIDNSGVVKESFVFDTVNYLSRKFFVLPTDDKNEHFNIIDFCSNSSNELNCQVSGIINVQTVFNEKKQFNYSIKTTDDCGVIVRKEVCFNVDNVLDFVYFDHLSKKFVSLGNNYTLIEDEINLRFPRFASQNVMNINGVVSLLDYSSVNINDFYLTDSSFTHFFDVIFISKNQFIISYKSENSDFLEVKSFKIINSEIQTRDTYKLNTSETAIYNVSLCFLDTNSLLILSNQKKRDKKQNYMDLVFQIVSIDELIDE